MSQDLAGTPDACVVHGFSAGADIVMIAATGADAAQDVSELARLPTVRALRAAGATGRLLSTAGSNRDVLALLAAAAAVDGAALVVVTGDLTISEPALLDLLDSPRSSTAALTVDPEGIPGGVEAMTLARVGADGRLIESVGTTVHSVSRPNRALPGVLRVDATDRATAAALWADAARASALSETEPWSLSLLVLVRGGLRVKALALGPFAFSRGRATAVGAKGGPWQQRLRAASRVGDGFVSTFAVRPLSRRLTAYGLRHAWKPNVVTMVSLALGVAAALFVVLDERWAWAVAALLLVLSLVVDCVDGELARFQRRFNPLGAWLDAVGDRVKEYAVLAAVAAAAVGSGRDLWCLASVTMAVVSARHFEDNAYQERLALSRASRPVRLPLDQARDSDADPGTLTALVTSLSRRQRAGRWLKRVAHMPIAERYVVMVAGLLLFRGDWLLWALLVTVGLSLVWSQGGRTVKALLGQDGWQRSPAQPHRWGVLDHQLDLGVLARGSGRLLRMPPGASLAGAVVLGTSVALRPISGWAALAAALVGAMLTGAGARPPLLGRLVWQLPALLWLAESAVVIGLATSVLGTDARGVSFGFLAAVAYHRYDVGYRLRDTRRAAAPWLALAGLGVEVRIVVLLALAALQPEWLGVAMAVLAVGLGVLYAAESAVGWQRWLHEGVAR